MARALRALAACPGISVCAVSALWRSAPFGGVRQPPFFNAVAVLRTTLEPHELLSEMARLERLAGRRRGRTWAARPLDMDLLAQGGRVMRPVGMGNRGHGRAAHAWQRRGLVLPHPGMAERAFVLAPLAQVAPDWRHPLLAASAAQLLARLPQRWQAQCVLIRHGPAFTAWRSMAGDAITIGCGPAEMCKAAVDLPVMCSSVVVQG